jgi:hypothetical protein
MAASAAMKDIGEGTVSGSSPGTSASSQPRRGASSPAWAGFFGKGMPYDVANVSLDDLAVMPLRQGRTAEVRHLTEEMIAVFQGQNLPDDALRAPRLFAAAAQRKETTAAMARDSASPIRQVVPRRAHGMMGRGLLREPGHELPRSALKLARSARKLVESAASLRAQATSWRGEDFSKSLRQEARGPTPQACTVSSQAREAGPQTGVISSQACGASRQACGLRPQAGGARTSRKVCARKLVG